MSKFYLQITIILLITFLMCSPLATYPVCAASQRLTAVVEIHPKYPNKDLTKIRHEVERELLATKRVRLIAIERIIDHLNHQQNELKEQTDGELLQREAEDLFLAFKAHKAIEVIDMSIALLNKNPGQHGALIKAYLLQSQIQLEQGKNKEALQSMRLAVAHDLSRKDIESYQYSPKMRRLFQKVRADFLAQEKIVDFMINVKSSQKNRIYVNGVYRGDGPDLVVRVPAEYQQMVSSGDVVKTLSFHPNKQKITLRDSSQASTKQMLGLKQQGLSVMANDALELGQSLQSDRVVLLETDLTGSVKELIVHAVDIKSATVSQTLRFEFVDLNSDLSALAQKVSRALVTLPRQSFVKFEPRSTGVTEIRKKSKLILPIVIGAVALVGGGVAAAMAMGGGGNSGTSGSSDRAVANISGPLPSLP